jgi:Family of unknown function (DUF6152)
MNLRLGAMSASAVFVAATSFATAHHSIAMFDHDHPIELAGIVREYSFTSPHAFIFLEVKSADGRAVIWRLEGMSPNSLTWDGWSNRTLRPGDEVRMTIEPLRSGAPGGTWSPKKTTFKDGRPIVAAR